jgi:hypothetical protein
MSNKNCPSTCDLQFDSFSSDFDVLTKKFVQNLITRQMVLKKNYIFF